MRLSSSATRRFTADLCALVRRDKGFPVAVSVARMDLSDDPVSSNAPSLTKPIV
jgi:hypothetical protein